MLNRVPPLENGEQWGTRFKIAQRLLHPTIYQARTFWAGVQGGAMQVGDLVRGVRENKSRESHLKNTRDVAPETSNSLKTLPTRQLSYNGTLN